MLVGGRFRRIRVDNTALKGNRNARCIEFLHPLVYIFLRSHANLHKAAGITGLVKRKTIPYSIYYSLAFFSLLSIFSFSYLTNSIEFK